MVRHYKQSPQTLVMLSPIIRRITPAPPGWCRFGYAIIRALVGVMMQPVCVANPRSRRPRK